MGYRPDPRLSELMSHLRTSQRHITHSVLAWVHDWPQSLTSQSNSQDLSSFEGAKSQAELLGFTLEEFIFDRQKITGRRFSHMLSSRGIRGIIIGPMYEPQTSFDLLWKSFCCVSIGFTLKSPVLNRVSNHQLYSLQLALQKAAALGYRQPLVWLYQSSSARVNDAWYAACALYERKFGIRVQIVERDQSTPEDILSYIRQYQIDVLLLAPLPALGSSTSFAKLIRAERKLIPNTLGIINIHHSPDTRQMRISGIDQQWDKVGAAAVDMLVNDINLNRPGIPETPKTLLIEGRWIDGVTTRKQKGQR